MLARQGKDAYHFVICLLADDRPRLETIWLDVFTDNEPAKRSYEKAGFSVEGVLRNSYYRVGRFRDAHRMSLLRSEWEALPRPKSWERDTP